MRQWGVLVLAVLLLAASAPAIALPTVSPGPFLARGPIRIDSDLNFTAANGVVAGDGTPASPYVISGWSIASGGTAIAILNVTASYVVRDNAIDAHVGVHITQSASVGVVHNNKFVVRSQGVLVVNSDANITNNSFIGDIRFGQSAKAVDLVNSNSLVKANAFLFVQYAVRAERGSPQILCNDLHDDVIEAGIYVRYTTNATISCNTITRCYSAIASVSAIGTVISNNTLDNCRFGIHAYLTKDVTVANNTLRFGLETQLKLDTVSGFVTGNVIIDGQAEAVLLYRSPVVFANNTVSNHLGVGVRIGESGPDVRANVIATNAVGIKLEGGSVPHLEANVLSNNTIGIDLPYASRQTITNMSANVVNGVNVDGAIDASQRVFFYKASNVTISTTMDGGFSAGYFGSLTAQGGILLWEVDTATIEASVVSHQNVGVSIVNSFDVVVSASAILSNLVGIRAEVLPASGPVPNCVVSVKDTNVTIPVDPVATIGIDVKGCLAIIARTNVSVVDTGIRVNAQAGLLLSNSTITQTKLALDVAGSSNLVNLSGNLVYGNLAGARLSGTHGVVANNTFLDNDEYGIRLENEADVDLRNNAFLANGVGLVDAEPCAGPLSCSSVRARNNSFLGNAGDGARVNGASTWRGDLAADNGEDGFDLASTVSMTRVVARDNGGDGARLVGTFAIEDSDFLRNGDDGLDLHGGGRLERTNMTQNAAAGIRAAPTFITARHLNVSDNLDGVSIAGAPVGGVGFDVHLSTLLSNERDGIRAPGALVNATHNYWGREEGPVVNVADQLGAFQNGVSPTVRFVPFFTSDEMDETGPFAGL